MQPTTSSESTSPLQPLVDALLNFHKTVPAINKTAKAQYGNFADLETVLSTVTPHLIKNGLVVSQGFEPNAVNHEGSPILTTRLIHVSGAEIVSRLPMIIGKNRNPLHDFGGSCTYSRRYSLLAILGLTADMDVDGDFANPAESAPAKPAAKIEGVANKDQPLAKEDREDCLGLIQELSPEGLQSFLAAFRSHFGLASDARIAPILTGVKHRDWVLQNLKHHV